MGSIPRTVRRTASAGLRLQLGGVGGAADATGVSGVVVHHLSIRLAGGQHHLVGVDDDDVVTGVDVGAEGGLVLATQHPGDLGRHSPQGQTLGVDDVPRPLDLGCSGCVGAHCAHSLCTHSLDLHDRDGLGSGTASPGLLGTADGLAPPLSQGRGTTIAAVRSEQQVRQPQLTARSSPSVGWRHGS